MSLNEELKSIYEANVCISDKHREAFRELRNQLLKEAEMNCRYTVNSDKYKILLNDKRVFEKWLNENELAYNGVSSNNKFLSLTIEW